MLRFARPTLGLFLAVLPAHSFQATAARRVESLPHVQELPVARAVIDAYLDKAGLTKACSETKSARLQGRFEILGTGLKGDYEILAAKPDLQSFRMELGSIGTMQSGYDGEVSWEVHPMTGVRLLHGVELEQAIFRADYSEPLKLSEKYERMETVDRVEFEGRPCWKLVLVAKPGPDVDPEESLAARTTHDYYDVETGLFAGAEFTNASAQGPLKVRTVASEYKRFGKRLVATKLLQEMPGQKVQLEILSLEYDTVEKSAFQRPE